MHYNLAFVKATGAGNDFVIINNWDDALQLDKASLAVAVCNRHFGVGADGLLILERSSRADFRMLYFNADGSFGGMCGNGGRCIARYAFLRGLAGSRMRFEALDHVYEAEMKDTTVRLHMKAPTDFRPELTLQASGKQYQCAFVNTGSPHLVLLEPALNEVDVRGVGKMLREHQAFSPEGTNVNFISIIAPDAIAIRTYERGVEDETLACGTGSVASAVIAVLNHRVEPSVKVHVQSGEVLQVHLQKVEGKISEIYLEGRADILFSGNMIYDDVSRRISQV